jgi:hypothetical protein
MYRRVYSGILCDTLTLYQPADIFFFSFIEGTVTAKVQCYRLESEERRKAG